MASFWRPETGGREAHERPSTNVQVREGKVLKQHIDHKEGGEGTGLKYTREGELVGWGGRREKNKNSPLSW